MGWPASTCSGEFVDGHVGALPGTIDGKEAEHGDIDAVDVAVNMGLEFVHALGGGIRADGAHDGIRFPERGIRAAPIDGRAAGEDQVRRLEVPARIEDMLGADDVDAVVEVGVLEGGADARTGGQMHDHFRLKFAKEPPDPILVADVDFVEGEWPDCSAWARLRCLIAGS